MDRERKGKKALGRTGKRQESVVHCKYFDRSGAVGVGDWEEVARLQESTVAQP